MPLSVTSNATTTEAVASTGCVGVQPDVARATRIRTPPCSVNLIAFESRFFRTCWSRFELVVMLRKSRSIATSNDRPRRSAS